MNVVRMNIRNCGGTELLGPTLYHSGLSSDVGAIARELLGRDRLPRVVIAGFSLGGNQVLKLAGELGTAVPAGICAVAAVSPSLDLIESSHALHHRSNRIYEWNFLRSVRRTLRRKLAAYPEVCAPGSARWYGSVRDFDHCVTAPHFGFASADDYYTRASASPLLPRIAIPTLILHAADDPFILLTPQTRRSILENPNLTFVETGTGGHCGFVAGRDGYDGFWAERQVVEFFRHFCLHSASA
jgi:predicted alpha/beta-fold hydrolase